MLRAYTEAVSRFPAGARSGRCWRIAPWALGGLLAFLLLLPAAHARGRGGPHGLGGGPDMLMRAGAVEAMAAELGVDDGTLAKIKDLAYASNRDAIALRGDLERAQLELHHMMEAASPDRNKIMAMVDVVGQAHTKLRKNRVSLLLDVRALLTPEQRAKLPALLKDAWGGRWGRGPGERWGDGPDGKPRRR